MGFHTVSLLPLSCIQQAERQRNRDTDKWEILSHLLIHFQKAHNSQRWSRLRPGIWNSVQVCYHLSHHSAVTQDRHSSEAGIRSEVVMPLLWLSTLSIQVQLQVSVVLFPIQLPDEASGKAADHDLSA